MKQGKAYGFFDCKASKQELEADFTKYKAKTASELELSLREVRDRVKDREVNQDLLDFVREREIYPTFSKQT